MATSIPFGLRGYMYHYRGGIVDADGRLDALGRDVQKVNAQFAAVGAELMRLSLPTAVYSTPISTDARWIAASSPSAVRNPSRSAVESALTAERGRSRARSDA